MDCHQYYEAEGLHGLYEREIIRFQLTLPHILSDGDLLDVGCREGYWLRFLHERTRLALAGIDISTSRIQAAKQLLDSNASFAVADARRLPLHNRSFTQVTAMETIEHIPEWKSALEELVRVSSQRVVVTVPYNERLKYAKCGGCGSRAPLYGHLHRFTEDDFQFLRDKGDVTFDFFPHPFGVYHYVMRALQVFTKPNVFKKGRQVASSPGDNSNNHLATICPACYDSVPYTKYAERGAELLVKLSTHKPEYLLVRVDK